MGIVAAIQMTSLDSLEKNLEVIENLVEKSVERGAQLVVLPEYFTYIGKQEIDKLKFAEMLGEGYIQSFLSNLAAKYEVWLVGGSIPIKKEGSKMYHSSCIVWNSKGYMVAKYDKIHLFNANLTEEEKYKEAEIFLPGKDVVCINTPIGKMGLSICFDLRFPELYRKLFYSGAEIVTVVSAFTRATGIAHWETLLRARAIENFCYIVASNQTGVHPNKRLTFGHSMIIDPWGKIITCLEDGQGIVVSEINLDYLWKIRKSFSQSAL